MKNLFIAFTALILSIASFSQSNSPIGLWKTIDDNTKKPKSIVKIYETKDGTLSGKIIKIFEENVETKNPNCDKCSGDKKDKPILGIDIIWDMKKKKRNWGDGKILDPNNGKIYSSQLKVIEDGKKLNVRGYIGISLFGRSQTWEQLSKAPPGSLK